jgi:hypothetical protein
MITLATHTVQKGRGINMSMDLPKVFTIMKFWPDAIIILYLVYVTTL